MVRRTRSVRFLSAGLVAVFALSLARGGFADVDSDEGPRLAAVAGDPDDGADGPQRRRREGANSCRRLTRQIDRYETVVDEARARGDDLWERNTRDHVRRLRNKHAERCPEYAQSMAAAIVAESAREMSRFFKTAAKAAVTYFTFGAY